jgi:hypothetical protein
VLAGERHAERLENRGDALDLGLIEIGPRRIVRNDPHDARLESKNVVGARRRSKLFQAISDPARDRATLPLASGRGRR